MLRIIDQEQARDTAWDTYLIYLQTPEKKGKRKLDFDQYVRRGGVQLLTPPSGQETELERQRQVRDVKKKLGRLYRPPIKA